MFGLYISNVNNGELVLSFFLTHGCCVTAFVSLCDYLHIPIAEHIKRTSKTNIRTLRFRSNIRLRSSF